MEGFRVSPQQKRLWPMQQASPAYRAQCLIRLDGRLQPAVVADALRQVVNRHEALRTTFVRQPGMKLPLQVVGERGAVAWEHQDRCDLDPAAQQASLRALWEDETRFDLEGGPLLHAMLIALSPVEHRLLLRLPTFCADAWTLKNLVMELSHLHARAAGEPEPAADVGADEEPVQYLQFSEWQNELLESEEAEAESARAFWRKQDFSSLAALKLLHEGALEAEAAPCAGRLVAVIDPAVAAKIEAIARERETSGGVFLLTCWQALLWRLTGQSEISVGLVSHGRRYEELHGAMGLFARCLPVTAVFAEDRPFVDLLARSHEAVQEAWDWQEYFAPGPDEMSFPVGFEEQERPPRFAAAGLSWTIERQQCVTELFKLKLTCVSGDGELAAEIEYDPRRYDAATIERLAGQYRTLVAGAAERPEARVGDLPILTAGERARLLFGLNETSVDFPGPACFHHAFEQQAERTPDAAALVFEERRLTYRELNARANQVAHHLRALGVGPDSLVALCLERSLEMIVGLLGVLKAGGAYVPLDPSLPAERLAFMLADSGAPVLLTQQALAAGLPHSDAQVVCLDTDAAAIAARCAANPESGVTGSDRAYVIYTSGSTGRPKGVEVEHRSLMNYVRAVIDRLDLPDGASFATVTTLAADLGHTAIFPALVTGGCLHVIAAERAADAEAWSEYCGRHRIDCLKIVPSHLAALLTCADPARALPRRRLVLGGEALSWELAEKAARLAPECRIFNHYGPTETTVGVLVHAVGGDKRIDGARTVPLGRPLANVRAYLLDAHGRPVPLGVEGELYIGGAGVARGYLGRPALTEERFMPDPFSEEPGARLYRTGDRARYLPDGNLEFLGRADDQVKIRGFRIEPGEIAAVLGQHPRVRECVVLARAAGDEQSAPEAVPGDRRLVAYLVAEGEPAPDAAELRGFLEEKLPSFMVPSAFVRLKALPLTRNGKLDRQALPAPASDARGAEGDGAAPRNPVEEVLSGIWVEVLGRERIGVQDNFFDLGGHSLLATQVIARVRSAFGAPVTLNALFAAPTVAGLAAEVERALRAQRRMSAGEGIDAPRLAPVARNRALPLSFAQQRLWFVDQLEPGSSLYNVPRAIRMRGTLNVVALQQTLAAIVARHEVLRTAFASVDGSPVPVIAAEAEIELSLVDLTARPEAEREAAARQRAAAEARKPFDLARGPLLRVTLLRVDRQDHLLLLTMHHIVSDGWSASVLSRELGALYAAFSQGQPSPLPPLPVQYADYAVWQRDWLQGPVLDQLLSYWRQQLHGAPPLLALPTDRPRPAVASFHGAAHSFTLDPSLSQALLALSRASGATLFMVLLAAFQALLHHWTGATDLVVGTDVANRTPVETEGLIGFFLNHLVLRGDLSGDPSFRELVGRVRQTALGAYAHQDLPFDKLVEVLKPERSAGHTPLFQVLFVLQNAPKSHLELPGLTLSSFETGYRMSKFDLSLFMSETDAGLRGIWWYRTDLFEPTTVEGIAGRLITLLAQVVAQPDVPLSRLDLRSEAEQEGETAAEQSREASQVDRLRSARRRAVGVTGGN